GTGDADPHLCAATGFPYGRALGRGALPARRRARRHVLVVLARDGLLRADRRRSKRVARGVTGALVLDRRRGPAARAARYRRVHGRSPPHLPRGLAARGRLARRKSAVVDGADLVRLPVRAGQRNRATVGARAGPRAPV